MAAKHRESYQRKIARLERENASLKVQVERLREAQRFLPSEKFCTQYGLLCETCFLSKPPEPEVKTFEVHRRGSKWHVTNVPAYKFKRNMDSELSKIAGKIYDYLDRMREEADEKVRRV